MSNSALLDLAGNAFNSYACMPITIAALAKVNFMEGTAQHGPVQPVDNSVALDAAQVPASACQPAVADAEHAPPDVHVPMMSSVNISTIGLSQDDDDDAPEF